jgi:uncharacterized repeat protein (TIGR02543 family)
MRLKCLLNCTLVAAQFGFLALPLRSQHLLNVDFGIGTNSAKVGFAATGQTTNDYWNLYSRDDGSGGYLTNGSVSNLKWADGTVSAVGLTVANAPGAWHNETADPMYNSYLYPLGGGNITVTVTNLPGGSYDIYIYGHGGPGVDTQNSVFEVGSGTNGYGPLATTTNSSWSSPVWEEGRQYVVFRDVGVGGNAVTITVAPGASPQASLNGIQIVQKSVTPDCVMPPSGLVHWWPGQGNANDAVGDSDGTLQNGAGFAEGKVGQAFTFDGVDDSVSFGNTAGNFDTNDFTVEFWMKTTSSRHEAVIGKRQACSVWGSMWVIWIGWSGPGRLEAAMTSDDAGSDLNSIHAGRSINDGLFHHVAFVRQGTNLVFYIDGVLDVAISTLSGSVTRINNATDLVAGRSVCEGAGILPFTGQLDEPSIYNRALAASEVEAIFHAGSAGKCAPAPEPECVPPASGLLAWWRGEGNAADTAAGQHGSPAGVTFAPGKVGQAFSFDGVDDSVSFGNTVGNFDTNDFTVEFWMRTTATDHESVIEKWPVCTHSSMWSIRIGSIAPWSGPGRLEAAISSDTGGSDLNAISAGRAINDGLFHHVALVRQGTNLVFYIDGVLDVETNVMSGSVSRINNTADLVMGRSVCVGVDGTTPFTGQMDEVSIYNRALSDSEIQAIYNAGGAGKCAPPPPPSSALAHWKFDETTGTVAQDSAGSFDGTLSSSGASFVPGGISGHAISIAKASNGFVNMANVLGMTGTDFSVVTWVKMNAGDTTESSVILSKQEAGWANGWVVVANASVAYGGPGKAWFSDSAFPGQEVTSTSSINDGNWHQIVSVYELGGTKSIYVDGAPVEASKPSLQIVPNSGLFLVGGDTYNGVPLGQFTGWIDDVQIYNFSLSSSNVDYLFQNPGQELRPQDVPVGEWRLTTVAGAGGTITRNPDLAKYTNGATVTVTAVPNAGFAFTSWSGDASGTTNPITITMNGNKTVTAGFREVPVRTLFVVNPEPRQEGEKIHLDLKLISPGDVGGMNFILRYNSQYLKEPKLDWSSALGSALDQINYDTPGQIRATFALPATAIPGGTQHVATVSFRTRSVPSDVTTDLGLELVDVSSPTGDSIRNGNLAQGGSARILVRRIIGDNNANDRLDVGDATIIQRLLIRLDPVRSWDITGNDLNTNTSLDSGDAVKVLRVVADLDPQPSPGGGPGPALAGGSRNGLRKAGPVSENIEISLDKTRAQPGELVTAQVRLKGITSTLAGASFTLEFPTNALRLVNAQSQKTGPLVPASAFSVWNVTPAQNNYTVQDGRVSVGISTPTVWPTNNGVLAEFTFMAQPEQTLQYRWPISVEGMEITEDGYGMQSLGGAESYYFGRDQIPPTLSPASVTLSSTGLSLTLAGEIGLPYTIEVSTDLVNWTPLTTQTASNGTLSFVDSQARNFTHRFYRAKAQ